MKKKLLILVFSLLIIPYAKAIDTVAIVDMNNLFQQIAKKTGISAKLESEFKNRASELQRIEGDLHNKMQHLQRNASIMEANELSKLEKDVMSQRHNFSQKAQAFELDRQHRSNEERDRLINLIQIAVKQVASEKNIDLVVDNTAIQYSSNDVKDITNDVLNRLNN